MYEKTVARVFEQFNQVKKWEGSEGYAPFATPQTYVLPKSKHALIVYEGVLGGEHIDMSATYGDLLFEHICKDETMPTGYFKLSEYLNKKFKNPQKNMMDGIAETEIYLAQFDPDLSYEELQQYENALIYSENALNFSISIS